MDPVQKNENKFDFYFTRSLFEEGLKHFLQEARTYRPVFSFSWKISKSRLRKYLDATNQYCRFLFILGDYTTAHKISRRLLRRYRNYLETDVERKADILHILSEVHFYEGEYALNQEKIAAAIAIKSKATEGTFLNHIYSYCQSLSVAGKGAWKEGDYYEALRCYFLSIITYVYKFRSYDNILVGRVLCLIGQVYLELNDTKKAQDYLLQGKSILERILTAHQGEGPAAPDHFYIGAALNELGKSYQYDEAPVLSQQYYDKARQILEQTFGPKPHRYRASVLRNEARLLRIAGDKTNTADHWRAALKKYQEELDMRQRAFGNIHPTIARVRIDMCHLHLKLDQPLEAAEAVHQGICVVSSDFSDKDLLSAPSRKAIRREKVSSMIMLLRCLKYKARSLLNVYEKTEEHKYLVAARKAINGAIECLVALREDYSSKESRRELGRQARSVHNLAIRILYFLRKTARVAGEIDRVAKLNQEILEVLQGSKVVLLLESLQKIDPMPSWTGGMPDNEAHSIQVLEQKLLSRHLELPGERESKEIIQFLKERENRTMTKNTTDRYASELNCSSSLLIHQQVKYRLEDLWQHLESDEKALIISYYVGEQSIYAITIAGVGRHFEIQELDLDEAPWFGEIDVVKELVEEIADSFNDHKSWNGAEKHSVDAFSNLESNKTRLYFNAYNLHKLLIGQLNLQDAQRLYIVPHDFLSKLPFEFLCSRLDRQEDLFNSEYLIQRYKISYHLSIALLYHNHADDNPASTVFTQWTGLNGQLLSIAGGKPGWSNTHLKCIEEIAGLLNPDRHEVQSPKQMQERSKAKSIKSVLAKMPHSQIIHIFSHSTFDASNRPGLILLDNRRKSKKELNDSVILTTDRIEKIDSLVKNHLILLSTCRGGAGEIDVGEGVQSLNRAFLEAKARNIYYTLFRINSEVARHFVLTFVKYLVNGENFVTAMQKTKLEMIIDPQKRNPINWVSPVFLGNQLQSLWSMNHRVKQEPPPPSEAGSTHKTGKEIS